MQRLWHSGAEVTLGHELFLPVDALLWLECEESPTLALAGPAGAWPRT